MVTRTAIARLEQRIEMAISRLNPEPPQPRHPGLDFLRKVLARYGGAEQAEASIAAAAREGYAHLKDHPEHPHHGRTVTAEEAQALDQAARAKSAARLPRWLGGPGSSGASQSEGGQDRDP
jgi:hypothetical protein